MSRWKSWADSNVVSLHLLLNDETKGFLSRERIAMMRKGSILINTARGAVVDEDAMLDALRSMLPWPQAARLDELAPEKMPIPSGGTRPIDWSGAHPVLTLRVQQAFGWTDTPRLVDGRVPLVLHLTDPAGRPAAVTSDLTSFWAGPYSDVRAQLRGRYPKHPWPEDPLHAEPTNRAKRRG